MNNSCLRSKYSLRYYLRKSISQLNDLKSFSNFILYKFQAHVLSQPEDFPQCIVGEAYVIRVKTPHQKSPIHHQVEQSYAVQIRDNRINQHYTPLEMTLFIPIPVNADKVHCKRHFWKHETKPEKLPCETSEYPSCSEHDHQSSNVRDFLCLGRSYRSSID